RQSPRNFREADQAEQASRAARLDIEQTTFADIGPEVSAKRRKTEGARRTRPTAGERGLGATTIDHAGETQRVEHLAKAICIELQLEIRARTTIGAHPFTGGGE